MLFHLPDIKKITPKIKDANDATGAPKPTPVSPIFIAIPNRYDAGILNNNEDIIPFVSENVVWPEPIKRPLRQKHRGAIK